LRFFENLKINRKDRRAIETLTASPFNFLIMLNLYMQPTYFPLTSLSSQPVTISGIHFQLSKFLMFLIPDTIIHNHDNLSSVRTEITPKAHQI